MRLIDDWRLIVRRAWSFRLAALAAVFSGMEVVLPLYVDRFPRGIFALVSFAVVIVALVSRVVYQQSMERDK